MPPPTPPQTRTGFLNIPHSHPIITVDRVKPVLLGAGRSGYPRVGCKLPSLGGTYPLKGENFVLAYTRTSLCCLIIMD